MEYSTSAPNERVYVTYHAACKAEFQPFNRSWSNFLLTMIDFEHYTYHTSRPNNNTSPITLYVNSRASSHFGWHVIYQALKQIQKNRQPDIISRTYIHTRKQTTKYSDPTPTTSGETMNKYDTGNYNYRLNNTTALGNLHHE